MAREPRRHQPKPLQAPPAPPGDCSPNPPSPRRASGGARRVRQSRAAWTRARLEECKRLLRDVVAASEAQGVRRTSTQPRHCPTGRSGGPGGHVGRPHRGRPGRNTETRELIDSILSAQERDAAARDTSRGGDSARREHRRGGGEGACKGEPAARGPDRHRVGVQGGADTAARGARHRAPESTSARAVHATLPVGRQEAVSQPLIRVRASVTLRHRTVIASYY